MGRAAADDFAELLEQAGIEEPEAI
jgi:hypothetical protein